MLVVTLCALPRVALCAAGPPASDQTSVPRASSEEAAAPSPRLVVMLVIDQFRPDFLTRLESRFCERGFRRFLDHGAFFANAAYSYSATATAAGHATLASGCIPRQHGIVVNEWFLDPGSSKSRAAVDDADTRLVGLDPETPTRGRSPRAFIGMSLGDQLKVLDPRSRVFGMALKDRSAILLAGRAADGAFWWHGATGRFVTSTWYMNELPGYLRDYNEQARVDRFAGQVWEPLLGPDAYTAARPVGARWLPFIARFGTKLPHSLPTLEGSERPFYYAALAASPFGGEMTLDIARMLVEHEQLGADDSVDMLCVSFSSNDACGHIFGPDSAEVLDLTLRTDRQIADFLDFLDQRVGLDRCLIALSADHGVSSTPLVLRDLRADTGFFDWQAIVKSLNDVVRNALGDAAPSSDLVLGVEMPWVYCDPAFDRLDAERDGALTRACLGVLRGTPGLAWVVPSSELEGACPPRDDLDRYLAWRCYYPGRSGRFYLKPAPFWYEKDDKIAGHTMCYSQDRLVPILLLGPGVRSGRFYAPADPLDVVPTLAALLGVVPPPGACGRVLYEAIGSGR